MSYRSTFTYTPVSNQIASISSSNKISFNNNDNNSKKLNYNTNGFANRNSIYDNNYETSIYDTPNDAYESFNKSPLVKSVAKLRPSNTYDTIFINNNNNNNSIKSNELVQSSSLSTTSSFSSYSGNTTPISPVNIRNNLTNSINNNNNKRHTNQFINESPNDNVFEELYSQPCKNQSSIINNVNKTNYDNLSNDESLNEWEKIQNIFASVGYMLENENVLRKNEQVDLNSHYSSINIDEYEYNKIEKLALSQFLEKISLNKYLLNFVTNGFDNTDFLNGVIEKEDLLAIEIKERYEVDRIMREIECLPIMNSIGDKQYNTIVDWLIDLKLDQYIEQFYSKNISTIEKLRKLYEIEFITLLGIRKIGHRKRMLRSLGFLKPKYSKQNSIRNSVTNTDFNRNSRALITPPVSPNGLLHESEDNSKQNFYNTENTSTSSSNRSYLLDNSSHFSRMKSVKFTELNNNRNSSNSTITDANYNSLSSLGIKGESDNETGRVDEKNLEEIINDKSNESFKTDKQLNNMQSQKLQKFKLTRELWRHDPMELKTTGCDYTINYLGTSPLNRLYSNKGPIKFTIDRLKASTRQSPHPPPLVILNISINGIKLLDTRTREQLLNHDIKHITSVCQDQEDLTYFALVTKVDPNLYHYCHVFLCSSAETSNELILTIGQSFDLAYEEYCKMKSFTA